jgi:hypothetical protein
MPVGVTKLKVLNFAFLILMLGFLNFSLYRTHQTLSVCRSQLAGVDALERQIDGVQKQIENMKR